MMPVVRLALSISLQITFPYLFVTRPGAERTRMTRTTIKFLNSTLPEASKRKRDAYSREEARESVNFTNLSKIFI